jgi:SPP1 family phage portal protein
MLFKNVKGLTPKTIKTLITKASPKHTEVKNLYERYCQTTKGVPIQTRKYIIDGKEQTDKINNKIANDFFGEIVNMKIGFFCGVPISYTLNKAKYQIEKAKTIIESLKTKVKTMMGNPEPETEIIISPVYELDNQVIADFNKLNSVDDLDLETSKRATMCGYCGRLPYIDVDKSIKMKLVEPWECIWIGDSIENPDAAIRYFDITNYELDGTEKNSSIAIVYTTSDITYYIKDPNNEYVLDLSHPINPESHYFGIVPLFGFANNDELMSDVGPSALTLIDAYDKVMSDDSSESEQTRLAYMLFKNCGISADTLTAARQTGAFSVTGEGADAGFITKELPVAFHTWFLKTLENNIYRFTATPNMNDQNFSGNITGIAIKEKFRPFEDKCKRAELKFKKSFMTQYILLCTIWKDLALADIDPMDMNYIFTRNYPENKIEEAQFLRDTKGFISEITRFSHSSLVDNPEEEIERLKMEEQENLESFVTRNEMMKDTSDETDKEEDTTASQDDSKQAISNTAKEE